MHAWFTQSGSRPGPWSASRRATLERRSLEGWIYTGSPCRRNAVQYDPGSAGIGAGVASIQNTFPFWYLLSHRFGRMLAALRPTTTILEFADRDEAGFTGSQESGQPADLSTSAKAAKGQR